MSRLPNSSGKRLCTTDIGIARLAGDAFAHLLLQERSLSSFRGGTDGVWPAALPNLSRRPQMKKFAFVVALVLLATVVPASAEETSSTPPPTSLEQQIKGPVQPIELGPREITPFCSAVQGTSCTTVGATRSCTDVCNNNLSCTCSYYYSNPSVKFWDCMWEC